MSVQFTPKYSVAEPDQNLRILVELIGQLVEILTAEPPAE